MLQGKRILIADDNKLNQKILIFVLQKSGALVDVAGNGKEAVDLMREQPFDAILMDVQMPLIDGLEASKMIRNDLKSTVPIIGLTASTMPSEFQKCLDAGMVACLSKPFDADELTKLIAELIQKNK